MSGDHPPSAPAGVGPLPLAGQRVVEFTHMVMGPAVGAVLAELGAEVIRIEPLGGDSTRNLPGSGAGYFPMYNRNKKSLCLDLKSPEDSRSRSGSADRRMWWSRTSAPVRWTSWASATRRSRPATRV